MLNAVSGPLRTRRMRAVWPAPVSSVKHALEVSLSMLVAVPVTVADVAPRANRIAVQFSCACALTAQTAPRTAAAATVRVFIAVLSMMRRARLEVDAGACKANRGKQRKCSFTSLVLWCGENRGELGFHSEPPAPHF